MNQRQVGHVAGVLVGSLLVRVLLFRVVGIWGDAGFYYYDAKLIAEGLVPFLDFIGRSPLFNYGYAAVAAWFGNDMATLRAFVVLWWLLAGIPVYLMAQRIHSHRAGLVAMILFELSPFMLIYGFWENTQSLAIFFAVWAVLAVVYRDDWLGYGAAGLLLGIAFLSRRSVITIAAALALYALWRAWDERRIRPLLSKGVAATVAFGLPLAVAYVLLAGGDISMAARFAETHAWGLFASAGRGGFPLITDTPAPPFQNVPENNVPILQTVCSQCGYWTARTFVKTAIVASVVLAPTLYYVRDWCDRWLADTLYWWASRGAIVIAVYGSYVALNAAYVWRVGVLWAYVVVGWLAFRADAPDRGVLYDRRVGLILLTLVMLAAGYLVRSRIIHTYYFSDFMPFVAIVGAICAVELWDGLPTDGGETDA